MSKPALNYEAEVKDSWERVREARKKTLETLREAVQATCDLAHKAVEAAIEEHPDLLLASSPGTTVKAKKKQ